jgi:hypothetical protein
MQIFTIKGQGVLKTKGKRQELATAGWAAKKTQPQALTHIAKAHLWPV